MVPAGKVDHIRLPVPGRAVGISGAALDKPCRAPGAEEFKE